jgi:hypothetical protein
LHAPPGRGGPPVEPHFTSGDAVVRFPFVTLQSKSELDGRQLDREMPLYIGIYGPYSSAQCIFNPGFDHWIRPLTLQTAKHKHGLTLACGRATNGVVCLLWHAIERRGIVKDARVPSINCAAESRRRRRPCQRRNKGAIELMSRSSRNETLLGPRTIIRWELCPSMLHVQTFDKSASMIAKKPAKS